ncbi:MAG: ribosome biogenesis GTPase Der [Candidatus Dormibacteria bacterium]
MSPAGATRRRRREDGDPIAPAVGVVAIVGRPNVGKSTLFNRLTGTRRAIVDAFAGLTRDRLYGVVEWGGKRFTVVDTAGLDVPLPRDTAPDIAALTRATREQAQMAITEADVCCFMVDVRDGVTALDEEIAQALRRGGRPVILVGNKADSQVDRYRADELYRLGLGDPVLISALQGTDTGDLLDRFVAELPEHGAAGTEPATGEVSVAIIGRPNTGKSSLLNGLVGSERALVSPVAGTTRDVVDTVVSLDGRRIRLVDTAGIRRRGIVTENVERYSLLRSLRALQRSDIGLLVIDASEGASAQDRHIAGYAVEAGAGLVVAANKWDLVKHEDRVDAGFLKKLQDSFSFVPGVPVLTLSATEHRNLKRVMPAVLAVADARAMHIPTPALNNLIRNALDEHPPRTHKGRRLKILYATQARSPVPTIVLFVNDPELMHFAYQRYLENRIRAAFGFAGVRLRIVTRHRDESDD